jgi:enoyl-CoA hydratase/carnithine racemase
MDDPEQSVNTLNERFTASLARAVQSLLDDNGAVRGVILCSAKRSFLAGGDLNRLSKVDAENRDEFVADLEARKARTRQLEQLPFPVVALLEGPTLGGGLELALVCHHRVAVEDPGVVVGLPEVTLGLLPGGGGVTRTTALLGPARALDLLLSGRRLTARAAYEVGLIDELATDPADGMARAVAWIESHPNAVQPWDRGTATRAAPVTGPPRGPGTAAGSLAAGMISSLVVEAPWRSFDEQLSAESEALGDLVVTDEAKATIAVVFFDSVRVRSRYRLGTTDRRRPVLALDSGVAAILHSALHQFAVINLDDPQLNRFYESDDHVVVVVLPTGTRPLGERPFAWIESDAVGDGGFVTEVFAKDEQAVLPVLHKLARSGIIPVLRGTDPRPLRVIIDTLGGEDPADEDPEPLRLVARRLVDTPGLLLHPEDLDVASVRAGGFPAWTGGAARFAMDSPAGRS